MSTMPKAIRFLSLLVLTASASAARGDAWARGTGQLFAHFGATTFTTEAIFDVRGRKVPFGGREYVEKGDNLYLELGLAPRLTFVGTLPRKKIRASGQVSDFTHQGFTDLALSLRYSLPLRGGLVAALDGGVVVPLGYSDDFPQLGSGRTDGTVNASVGWSVPFLPEGFLTAELGYRLPGGPISNEMPYA